MCSVQQLLSNAFFFVYKNRRHTVDTSRWYETIIYLSLGYSSIHFIHVLVCRSMLDAGDFRFSFLFFNFVLIGTQFLCNIGYRIGAYTVLVCVCACACLCIYGYYNIRSKRFVTHWMGQRAQCAALQYTTISNDVVFTRWSNWSTIHTTWFFFLSSSSSFLDFFLFFFHSFIAV